MEADFTLVPIGGLGNRINAICSAIVYCRQNNKSLKILWFKDQGLNCSVNKLFSISLSIKNVQLSDATRFDLLLRDNPRRKNLWIPKLFQRIMYDRRIYDSEVYRVVSSYAQPDFGMLNSYKHIFMVNYWRFWIDSDMWKSFIIKPEILDRVKQITDIFPANIIGVHIRRSDNYYSIKYSPIELFIQMMKDEIAQDENVVFYVASDSVSEKKVLQEIFGNKIIIEMKETSRGNESGIIDAFIEMNVLSKTRKIYASAFSSFSELASHLTGIEYIIVANNPKEITEILNKQSQAQVIL